MSIISVPSSSPRRFVLLDAVGRTLSLNDGIVDTAIGLDLLERAILVILFGFFAVGMTASFELTSNVAVPLLLASEVLPILLIVFRKWSAAHTMSINPFDWMLAFAGANAPLLAVAGVPGSFIPQELCSLVILSGLLLQISAKFVLWRSFGVVAAVRDIKVSGPYRFVRHPMYAGYTIVHIGFLMAFPSIWNFVVYAGALLVQIARLLREEQLLRTDFTYREFSSRVRYRLLPGVF
jgi:protein-S-isoprenylcysteine O-methyltransferase Ste14